jgi:hypothetical protein
MVGRTQCEAEEIYRRVADNSANRAKELEAAAIVSLASGAPHAAAILAAAGGFFEVFSIRADKYADQFEKGCKREIYEQGKKDAAAAASGTTSNSDSDPGHREMPSADAAGRNCGSMWIPGYVTEDENGVNVTSGKSVGVCAPIALDLVQRHRERPEPKRGPPRRDRRKQAPRQPLAERQLVHGEDQRPRQQVRNHQAEVVHFLLSQGRNLKQPTLTRGTSLARRRG